MKHNKPRARIQTLPLRAAGAQPRLACPSCGTRYKPANLRRGICPRSPCPLLVQLQAAGRLKTPLP